MIPTLGSKLTDEQLQFLRAFSTSCRRSIISMVSNAASGHPGGSLSCIDYLSLLYSCIISQTGEKVVISNGHISPAVYSVLGEMGYAEKEEAIQSFRQANSIFEGHVSRHVPGVWYGTGPLGIGVSVAAGFAHSEMLKKSGQRVFALLGDGEAQEGQVYEMMHYAAKYQLSNFIVFMDYNAIQLSGPLKEIMPVDFFPTFRAAEWNVLEVDGHEYQALWDALGTASKSDRPTLIMGKTIMGKGVDFMEKDSLENTYNWHGVAPNKEQSKKALDQLSLSESEKELLEQFRKTQIRWKPDAPYHNEKKPLQVQTGKPHILTADVVTDCRSAYGNALNDLASLNPSIVALTADLGGSVKTDSMKKSAPQRVFDVGVAEQHLVSCSGAFSLSEFVPFCSTFGAFMTSRAKDQARVNDINRTNVKMVATHCGLSVGEDGPTHQAIDDLGSFSGFFHTTLLEPADPNHCDHLIRFAAKTFGNFYVRMGRSKIPILTKSDGSPYYDEQFVFHLGSYDHLREGSHLSIFASGPMVNFALQVEAKLLPQYTCDIIVMNSLSHPDETLIRKSIQKTGKVLVLEDHNPHNGYAAMMSRILVNHRLHPLFASLGVSEYQLSGKAEELYDIAHLGVAAIEEKALAMLQKS